MSNGFKVMGLLGVGISPAQCGDGLDALLLLHALYLPGIRSTYLEHQEEDTQRLSEWGSLRVLYYLSMEGQQWVDFL